MFQTVVMSLNEGFVKSLEIFILTLLGAIPLGLIMSFGSMSGFKPLKGLVRTIVWIFRGSPLMIQLLLIYYAPGMLGYNIWGTGSSGRFAAAMAAFILNYACYFSEIFRGGIESIPRGQKEAGQVLGMTGTQIFFKVTLLQVIKRIVPPMGNEIITLVKDTSLAANITVVEMFMATQRIVARTYEPLLLYIEVGLIYLIFCTVLTRVQSWGEKRLRTYGRR